MALQEEFEKQGVWLFRYRSTLPLIILAIGLGVHLWTELNPMRFSLKGGSYEDYYEYLCLLVSLFGLYVRSYTVGYTPKNTSGRNVKEQVADKLNTRGIYSTVRHPLYVGNFLMWLGPAMLTGHLWFVLVFCFFYWVYYERIMFAEEQFLRRKFAGVYTSWAEKIPAFVPSLRNFEKPDIPFSWKKVLKKEKNGLAATFVIFCAFDLAGESIKGDHNFNYFFIWGCGLSLVLYFILKYLKNRTGVLDEEGR